MPPRLWHWDYFQIHTPKDPQSIWKDYHGNDKVFVNAWCQACVTHTIQTMLRQDTQALDHGAIPAAQAPSELLEQGE